MNVENHVSISCKEKEEIEDETQVEVRSSKEKWRQFRAAFSVSYLSISAGMTLAYTATAVPSMLQDWVNFPGLGPQEISWIGGLTPLGALSGSLIAMIPIRKIGSKYTILFFATPSFLIANLIIAFSLKGLMLIFIARFLGGIGVGLVISSCPLYVIEIASDEYRGRLGILPQFLLIFGLWLSNVFGTFLTWRNLALASFLTILPSIPLLLSSPNSPAYFLRRNKFDKAILSHEFLHPIKGQKRSRNTQNLLQHPLIPSSQLNEKSSPTTNSTHQSGLEASRIGQRSKVATIKACAVALGLMSFQQLTGINGVAFYSVTIFKQANKDGGGPDAYMAAIFLISVQMLAVFISTCLVERLGRKILILISSSLLCLSANGLATYFYFCAEGQGNEEYCTRLYWLPLTFLVSFVFAFAIGFGPLSYVILTEMLPANVRNFMNPMAIGYSWFCVFLVTASFPILMIRIQLYGIFFLYGSLAFIGVIFIQNFIPETKNKSLLEIQAFFEGTSNNSE